MWSKLFFPRIAALFSFALGTLALTGWALDVKLLRCEVPGLATIPINTATAFIGCGLTLSLLTPSSGARWRRFVGKSIAAAIGILAVLTLVEQFAPTGLDLDRGVPRLFNAVTGLQVRGRMATATAINFLLLSIALGLLNLKRWYWPGDLLTVIPLFITLLAFTGSAFRYTTLPSTQSARLPLPVLVAFLMLSVGTMAARPDRGWMAVITGQMIGSVLARRLLPFAVLVPFLLGWTRLVSMRAGFPGPELGLALYVLANMIVLACVVVWYASRLNHSDTRRVSTEIELWESEQDFRGAFEDTNLATVLTDLEYRFVRVNSAFARFVGYSSNELLCMCMADITHPDDLAESDERRRYLLSGAATYFQVETRLLRKDGQIVWGLVNLALVRDRHGEPLRYVGQVQDITLRKQTEVELRQIHAELELRVRERTAESNRANETLSELLADSRRHASQLRGLAEASLEIASISNVPELLNALADWARGMSDANEAVAVLTTESGGGNLGLGHSVAPESSSDSLLLVALEQDGILERICQNRQPLRWSVHARSIELPAELPTRPVRLTELLGIPLKARDATSLGALVVANKVGGGEFTEEDSIILLQLARLGAVSVEAIRSREKLQVANQELESFSYSVSHDLRAPLRAIDGFSRILQTEHAAELSNEGRELLNDIRVNARQMGQLVDDLLRLGRLGRQALRLQPIHPRSIVDECVSELRIANPGHSIEFHIGELLTCQADPTLVRQIWMNLLSNAVKYSSQSNPSIIEIGSRNGDLVGERIYYIRDNGVGFDMKNAHKLFGLFQRLHRAEDYDGTGVGLAIVQRLVHRHGGRVWAEAEPGRGATFSFTLPGDMSPNE